METIKGHETDRLKPLTQYKFIRSMIHSGAISETPSEFVNRIKSDTFQGQMWKRDIGSSDVTMWKLNKESMNLKKMKSKGIMKEMVLFLSFRRVLNVICSFLGNFPASEF